MRHSTLLATLVLTFANVTYAEANAIKEVSSLALSSTTALQQLEAPGAGSTNDRELPGHNFSVQRNELQQIISEKMSKKLEEQLSRELANEVQ